MTMVLLEALQRNLPKKTWGVHFPQVSFVMKGWLETTGPAPPPELPQETHSWSRTQKLFTHCKQQDDKDKTAP